MIFSVVTGITVATVVTEDFHVAVIVTTIAGLEVTEGEDTLNCTVIKKGCILYNTILIKPITIFVKPHSSTVIWFSERHRAVDGKITTFDDVVSQGVR